MSAAAFLRLFALRVRRPGETAAEALERSKATLPTVAELAETEKRSRRHTGLQKARAI